MLLRECGVLVVAVDADEDAETVGLARRLRIPVVIGRAANPELLRRLSLGTARAFAAVTNEDLANIESAMTARSLNPDLRVVLRAGDGDVSEETRSLARIGHVVDVHRLARGVHRGRGARLRRGLGGAARRPRGAAAAGRRARDGAAGGRSLSPLPTKSVDKLDLATMAVTTERCTGGIVKPLPPEWFIQKGTSAEMRWEAMQRAGLRWCRRSASSSATTPRRRASTRSPTELEISGAASAAAPVSFSYDELTSLPSRRADRRHRVRRQRALAVRRRSRACEMPGHRVGARGDRRHALARRAAGRGARARGHARRRRRRDAGRARRRPTSPTASTTGACGGRCRSARRSTTSCSPTR